MLNVLHTLVIIMLNEQHTYICIWYVDEEMRIVKQLFSDVGFVGCWCAIIVGLYMHWIARVWFWIAV